MPNIDFPVDEMWTAIQDRVWDFRNEFSPPLIGSDLDEFWGCETETDEVPIPGVIGEPLGGELVVIGGGSASDDTHRGRLSIFSEVPEDKTQRRPVSLALLRQLVKVLRRDDFLEGLNFDVPGCQIQEIVPTGYEPNNTFFAFNIAGWGLGVEIRMLCQEQYT